MGAWTGIGIRVGSYTLRSAFLGSTTPIISVHMHMVPLRVCAAAKAVTVGRDLVDGQCMPAGGVIMASHRVAMGQADRCGTAGLLNSIKVGIGCIYAHRHPAGSPGNPCATPEGAWIGIIGRHVNTADGIDDFPHISKALLKAGNIAADTAQALRQIAILRRHERL